MTSIANDDDAGQKIVPLDQSLLAIATEAEAEHHRIAKEMTRLAHRKRLAETLAQNARGLLTAMDQINAYQDIEPESG